MSEPLFAGLDIGTSGVRAVAIDAAGTVRAQAARPLPAPRREGAIVFQDPAVWWQAVGEVLTELSGAAAGGRLRALAVDGTSGTLLLADATGEPVTPGLMYNDAGGGEQAARIRDAAPPECAAHGASSALARLLRLQARAPRARHALHQADWIAGRLCGVYGVSDENNALKTGYDVVARRWPDWFDALAVRRELLPRVVAPGQPIGTLDRAVAAGFGLPAELTVVAGTTDGVAAFLATGASAIGDAVTSLGTTLVVKVLSDRPLFAPEYGIYSHRLGERWLPGGASNSGGAALLAHFDTAAMRALTPALQPDRPTGLRYYPLPSPGERFPINDPRLQPVVEPRPADDRVFFQGLLEGIADIEGQAYRRLESLGAPYPRSVRSVGGGAANRAWTRIRARTLGVEMIEPLSGDAAYGAALLAQRGVSHD